MTIEDYKVVFVSISIILMLLFTSPIIIALYPEDMESYMVMAVLGQKGTADQYYPNNNPNIELNVPVSWYLQLYNHIGQAQYVLLKAKLLNSTLPSPNSSIGLPSAEPSFFEIRYFLAMNETRIFPFRWQVSQVIYEEDVVIVNELIVNDQTYTLYSLAKNGYNFRIVFELWFYDEHSRKFEFTRQYLGKNICVWNQMWLNVTASL